MPQTDDPITIDILGSFALRSYRISEAKRKRAVLKEFIREKILVYASNITRYPLARRMDDGNRTV